MNSLIGSRIQFRSFSGAQLEALVLDYRDLEPNDDSVILVRLDNGDEMFVPISEVKKPE